MLVTQEIASPYTGTPCILRIVTLTAVHLLLFLQLLDGFSLVDKMWNRSYVLSTQGQYTGGFSKWPDAHPGKFPTCHSSPGFICMWWEGLQCAGVDHIWLNIIPVSYHDVGILGFCNFGNVPTCNLFW